MTKAIALGNNFLLTAIASSFLCWLASLHPSLLLFVQALFALKLIISATAWLLDDAIIAILRIDLLYQFHKRLLHLVSGIFVS
jgi:small multidrug resistance family-3 protein